MESQFNGSETRPIWQGLQKIPDYKRKSSHVVDTVVLLPDKLNKFFARFENNVYISYNKTKEMIVDYKKQQREHPPIHIDGTALEKVESFKFLGVHITDKLKWSSHTDSVVKKAQRRLFNLRRLKKFVNT